MLRPSSLLWSQGIHHILLNFLLGNLKTAILLYSVIWNHITECFLPAHLHNPIKDPCSFNTAKWNAWWNLIVKNRVRPAPLITPSSGTKNRLFLSGFSATAYPCSYFFRLDNWFLVCILTWGIVYTSHFCCQQVGSQEAYFKGTHIFLLKNCSNSAPVAPRSPLK